MLMNALFSKSVYNSWQVGTVKNTSSPKQATFFYGWAVVGASALIMIGAYGAQVSFSVFLKPLVEEFGWTRAATSGAMSLAMGISGLAGIIMGQLTDRYGARILIVIGALIGGLGYLLMSQSSSLWHLYVYFGFCTGLCSGSCWTPITATVSKWFVEKRVLALGITTIGIMVGQMLLPPLVALVVVPYGWRFTYVMLSIVVWITVVPAAILLGRNPPQHAEVAYRGEAKSDLVDSKVVGLIQPRELLTAEAVRTAPFWMLMITGFVTGTGFYFMSTHVVACATDLGVPITSAALILTFLNTGSIAGTLLAWPITTRIGNRFTLLLLLALQAFAMFFLAWARSLWAFLALAFLFGFGLGPCPPVRTAMIPQLFGVRSIGTIIGLAAAAFSAGGIVGPVLAGYVFDVSQSYGIAFSAGGLLMIAGMLAVYFLDGRGV
jgi:MFS family permease